MKASKLLLPLLCMTLSLAVLGCSVTEFFLPQKPVYVPPGVLVEVAKDFRAECWITNKQTGSRERRMVDVQGGWMILRPRTDFVPTEPKREEDPRPEAEVTAPRVQ